ncbi:RcnB family protein [Acinetobacter piscicola]|uniref:RcnB family protein n=1 Tax=Acinetobacter piscicola TaxID=2006115 RepID=UPI000B7FD945|nr:RcnB family protein [Acinetobacter piscicola]
MKKVLTAITLSLSALVATSTMAASHDNHQDRYDRYQQNYWDHKHDNRWNNNDRYDKYDRYNNRVNPSREWRSGQYLPSQFSSSRYHVNYKNYRQLPKQGRYQQWYKVNGDYVLVNERNNRIIRVIG